MHHLYFQTQNTLTYNINSKQSLFKLISKEAAMFNMKKLIDQTDFDNLNQLTSHWNDHDHDVKENQSIRSNFKQDQKPIKNSEAQQQKYQQIQPRNARKRNVVPQVMDQDTEQFKNKLENLLNNFKIDAVSEFMAMKKDMLSYQKQCVKTDTQKYLEMYEQKHQELLETKVKLLAMSKQAEKKTIQVQLLSEHIGKLNQRLRITKHLSRPFSILYQNKVEEQQMKFKEKQARIFDEKRLKKKSIWGWIHLYKQHKSETEKASTEERIEKEVSDIVGRFQKQMELLKQKLEQVTRKNEEYENNKHMIHENLKKAFLRGMCAMNMEAMGVLNSQNAEETDMMSEKDHYAKTENERSYIANNMSFVDHRTSREEVTQNQSMFASKAQTATKMNSTVINISKTSNPMIVNSSKAESKNHKWKEAPIMGVEEKIENEEPRMQIVRPTTEGKVIKVVDGKSAVETGVHKAPQATGKKIQSDRFSVASSSRKKI